MELSRSYGARSNYSSIHFRALVSAINEHWATLLAVCTFFRGLIYTSSPYYVDGPAHIRAITSRSLYIQPPGYLLHAVFGVFVTALFRISPALAVQLINIFASAAGAFLFAKLASTFYRPKYAMALATCYAFSDVIWFVSDIHSTYALSAALVVALLYLWRGNDAGWWMGLVWALQAGVRPSEGLFTLPFVAIILFREGRAQAVRFACAALPIVALWYIPTALHFGGGPLAPLRSSSGVAESLSNGFLTHVPLQRKMANLLHLISAALDSWNILTVSMVWGFFITKNTWMRSLVWLIVPGVAFYLLIFFSDATYLAYLIAPGFLLAGEGLRRLPPVQKLAILAAAFLISVGQMTLCRPIVTRSTTTAILNAYVLRYTGWSIRHGYVMGLEQAMRDVPKSH